MNATRRQAQLEREGSLMATITERIPPAQTPQGHLAHLGQANAVRIARAKLKRDLKPLGLRAAVGEVAALITSNAQLVASMRVRELLTAVPTVGEAVADKMLFRAGVTRPAARIRMLTAKQRTGLVIQLNERGVEAARRRRQQAQAQGRPKPKLKPRPPRPSLRTCVECGEQMRKPSDDGRCGFCQAGLAA